jgi:hypothetical protein
MEREALRGLGADARQLREFLDDAGDLGRKERHGRMIVAEKKKPKQEGTEVSEGTEGTDVP